MGKFQLESIRSENAPSTCCKECESSNCILHGNMPCYCWQHQLVALRAGPNGSKMGAITKWANRLLLTFTTLQNFQNVPRILKA